MKKVFSILGSSLIVFALASCGENNVSTSNSTYEISTIAETTSANGDKTTSTSGVKETTTTGVKETTSTSGVKETTTTGTSTQTSISLIDTDKKNEDYYKVVIDDIDVVESFEGEKLNINCASLYAGNYDTNFATKSVSGVKISAYRSGKYFSTIYPDSYLFTYEDYQGRDGAIFNATPVDDILSIEITYKASDSLGIKNPVNPNVTFGTDIRCIDYKYDLDLSASNTTKYLNVSSQKFDFFSINSGDYQTSISSITVTYTSSSYDDVETFAESGKGLTRMHPVTYTGTLVPGSSKVTVPTEVKFDPVNNRYVATQTRELTYYTLDYVKANPGVVDDAAMITPEEVSMYYTAFKQFPANYILKDGSSTTELENVFGDKARYVSEYNRKNGYALSVPWRQTGNYYEFDINVTGTYRLNSRGTGRVVAWDSGFDADGYANDIVCLYTDDHYDTWLEYYNDGSWSYRYNGQGCAYGITFGAPTTVEVYGYSFN